MKKSKTFLPFKENFSYSSERRIVYLISMLYSNSKKGENKDFFEEYLKNPENTLERIENIFEENEILKSNNKDLSHRELDLISMHNSLNLIIDIDNLDSKNEILQKNIEQNLTNMFITQINNITPHNKSELYNILYKIEGFNITLSQKSNLLSSLKEKIIEHYLENHPNEDLQKIIKDLPTNASDTYIDFEKKLLNKIFDVDLDVTDIRYNGIKLSFKNIYVNREKEKIVNALISKDKKDLSNLDDITL